MMPRSHRQRGLEGLNDQRPSHELGPRFSSVSSGYRRVCLAVTSHNVYFNPIFGPPVDL